MSSILQMPKLGLTMTEGTLAQWLVPVGQTFRKGQPLYVLETEKVANEIEAEADGVLEVLLVDEGATVAVGTPIARWRAAPGTAAAADAGSPGTDSSEAARSAAAASSPAASRAGAPTAVRRKPHVRLIAVVRDVMPATLAAPARAGRIIASPYARRLARAAGLDLALVDTARARITAADVQRALGHVASFAPRN